MASRIGYTPSTVRRPGNTITSSEALSVKTVSASQLGSGPHDSMKHGGDTASTGSGNTTQSGSRPVSAAATAVRRSVDALTGAPLRDPELLVVRDQHRRPPC